MKTFLKNLLTILISTCVTLLLLEGGVRYLNRQLGHYPRKDPILHHSLKPNAKLRRTNNEFDVTYEINSYGFRDREFSLEKPPKTYRILMLGDSYTFGIGSNLQETFSKLLEKRLNEGKKSVRFEVINGGCSSYSPILEYLLLVQKGLALNPDLVILNYDLSDVQDDYKYSQIAQFDSQGHPLKVPPIDVQWYYQDPHVKFRSRFGILNHSELYQFVMKRYYQLKGEQDAPVFYERAKAIAGNIDYDRDITLRDNAQDWKPYFDQSARYLQMIHGLLQEKKIGFVLTSYPDGALVNLKEWAIGRKLRGFDDKIYTTRLFEFLGQFAHSEQIPYLDMLPDFQQAKDFPLFFPYDGHFTPAGQRIAAEALDRFLKEKNLIPSSTQAAFVRSGP